MTLVKLGEGAPQGVGLAQRLLDIHSLQLGMSSISMCMRTIDDGW